MCPGWRGSPLSQGREGVVITVFWRDGHNWCGLRRGLSLPAEAGRSAALPALPQLLWVPPREPETFSSHHHHPSGGAGKGKEESWKDVILMGYSLRSPTAQTHRKRRSSMPGTIICTCPM